MPELPPDVKDRRDAYEKLQKEVTESKKKRAVVSTRNGELNVEAGKLFKDWEGSTAAIQDPALRQRSQERRPQAKSHSVFRRTARARPSDKCRSSIMHVQRH